jgi:hypothetical protein
MIIVKVQGGLGNQLLQYSFGRALALSYKKDVAYDLTFFDTGTKYTERPYLLDNFTLSVRRATPDEILYARYPFGVLSKLTSLVSRFLNKYFLKKYYVGYTSSLIPMLKRVDSYYIEGFWQSYKYYEDNLTTLNEEITLRNTNAVEHFKEETSFDDKVSVSVHIRRGDFTKVHAGTKALGTEYYEKAVQVLESTITNPTYFVFSDDIAWVKAQMSRLFKDVVYVSSHGLKDYEEFAIMKECKHAILSNSTFSWTATLLTNRNDKIVIYSHDWKNPYLNGDKNICPPAWMEI